MQIDSATTALVTGGSRGIGLTTGRALAARGVRVGLLARSRDGLEEAVASLRPSPAGDHLKLLADIGRGREVERAVERFVRQAGRLDLIVANAGIAHYGPFVGSDVEDAEEMVRVNVLGTIYTVRAALGPMLERRHGHVVVLSSGAGLRAFPGAAVYGGTKAFGRGFAEALRHELAGTGVGLTTVFPGEIATDLHAHERDLLPDWRKNEEELPPEPLAEAIVDAVAADRRRVFVPRVVGLLGINGVAPRLTDVLLAKIRGRSAAPRLD